MSVMGSVECAMRAVAKRKAEQPHGHLASQKTILLLLYCLNSVIGYIVRLINYILPLEIHAELACSRGSGSVEVAVVYVERDTAASVVVLVHFAPERFVCTVGATKVVFVGQGVENLFIAQLAYVATRYFTKIVYYITQLFGSIVALKYIHII